MGPDPSGGCWADLLDAMGLVFDPHRETLVDPVRNKHLAPQPTRILKALASAPAGELTVYDLGQAGRIGATSRRTRKNRTNEQLEEMERKRVSECIRELIDPFLEGSPFEVVTPAGGQTRVLRRIQSAGSTPSGLRTSGMAEGALRTRPVGSGTDWPTPSLLTDGRDVTFVLGTGLAKAGASTFPRVVDALGIAECAAGIARRSPSTSIRSRLDVDIDYATGGPKGHVIAIGSSEVNVCSSRAIDGARSAVSFAELSNSPPGISGLSLAGTARSQLNSGMYTGMLQELPSPWDPDGRVVIAQGYGHAGTIGATLLLSRLLESVRIGGLRVVDGGRTVCFLVNVRVTLRGSERQEPGRLLDRFSPNLPISDPIEQESLEFLE